MYIKVMVPGTEIAITLEQLVALDLMRETFGTDMIGWHPNDCGCCVSVHTTLGDFLVGQDGEFDYFPPDEEPTVAVKLSPDEGAADFICLPNGTTILIATLRDLANE